MMKNERRLRPARRPQKASRLSDGQPVLLCGPAAVFALIAAIFFREQLPRWFRMGMLIAVYLLVLFTFLELYLRALENEKGTPAGDKPVPPGDERGGCGEHRHAA